MIHTIPENKYKTVKIGKLVEATGFKSETHEHPDGFNKPSKLNNDMVSLSIKTNYDKSADFKFRIHGRKDLLKLKEAIDFALEIDDA